MRFATHEDFVRQHLRWTFSLRLCAKSLPHPMFTGSGLEIQESVCVCTAELWFNERLKVLPKMAQIKICVVSTDMAAAWLELCDKVEQAEREGN